MLLVYVSKPPKKLKSFLEKEGQKLSGSIYVFFSEVQRRLRALIELCQSLDFLEDSGVSLILPKSSEPGGYSHYSFGNPKKKFETFGHFVLIGSKLSKKEERETKERLESVASSFFDAF